MNSYESFKADICNVFTIANYLLHTTFNVIYNAVAGLFLVFIMYLPAFMLLFNVENWFSYRVADYVGMLAVIYMIVVFVLMMRFAIKNSKAIKTEITKEH